MTDSTAVTSPGADLGPYQSLVDYGVLGLVVLALGAIGWYMFKKHMAEKDEMKKRIEELEAELKEAKEAKKTRKA
jgi:uncharacterized protein HemX